MRKVRALEKRSTTVGSETYLRIKRDIIFGDLAPGTKLKLNGLKERYETSMSTLRETLNRLASEGFVDALEQRGLVSRVDNAKLRRQRGFNNEGGASGRGPLVGRYG